MLKVAQKVLNQHEFQKIIKLTTAIDYNTFVTLHSVLPLPRITCSGVPTKILRAVRSYAVIAGRG